MKENRNLTEAQIKSQKADEIACRISLAIAFVAVVFAIINHAPIN